MKFFNLIFQSEVPSTTTAGEVFYYDWSQLPQGAYKVTFVFVGAIATLTNTTIANIFCDLGQNSQIVSASNQSYRTGFLGALQFTTSDADGSLYATLTNNIPIYLNQRPTNNRVFIEIHANTGTFETNYAPVSGKYTLSMCFELLE
jgi:hypothetical protein